MENAGFEIFFIMMLEGALAFYGGCKRIGVNVIFLCIVCMQSYLFLCVYMCLRVISYKMKTQKSLRPVSQSDIGSVCSVR